MTAPNPVYGGGITHRWVTPHTYNTQQTTFIVVAPTRPIMNVYVNVRVERTSICKELLDCLLCCFFCEKIPNVTHDVFGRPDLDHEPSSESESDLEIGE